MPATTTAAAATADQALLDDVMAFLRRFIIFQDETHYLILALWILHTYTFEAGIPYATPYLYIHSAEKQCGKSRCIQVAALLAHNPITADKVSSAALFRVIESQRPTLFMDEIDAVFTGAANEELRGMLNGGYKKTGTVLRVVPGMGEDGQPGVMPFSTFCPKLLAGIENGALPDTIADRSILINLKRAKSSERVERLIERKVAPEAEALQARIQAWTAANVDAMLDVEPKFLEGISDRAFEIAEPLLVVASRFKGATDKTRKALVHLLGEKKAKLSPGAEALLAARNLLSDGRDKLTSAELATSLDMSAKRLGLLLAPYGITPRTIRLAGGVTQKGYHRRDFQDAWERYL